MVSTNHSQAILNELNRKLKKRFWFLVAVDNTFSWLIFISRFIKENDIQGEPYLLHFICALLFFIFYEIGRQFKMNNSRLNIHIGEKNSNRRTQFC